MKRFLYALMMASGVLIAQENTYYIGHSGFGWDLIVGAMVQDMATDAGKTSYDYGYQFIGGTCITNQWFSHADPQGGTDSWVELGTGNYNNLVIAEQIPIQEVIDGSPWCYDSIRTSYQSLDYFYDLAVEANPDIQIYLMEFHNEVDQTSDNPYQNWVDLNAEMRPLWEKVADSVSSVNSGKAICIVPVAAAYQKLVDTIRSGADLGFDNWLDIFDPTDQAVATIHPTEMTYYQSACVHYATIFGESPVGLTYSTTSAEGWGFDAPTAAQAKVMQEIAWEVVQNDAYSCLNTDTLSSVPAVLEEKLTVLNMQNSLVFDLEQEAQFTLFDMQGKSVYQEIALQGTNTIELEHLPSGMYIYALKNNIIGQQGKILKE